MFQYNIESKEPNGYYGNFVGVGLLFKRIGVTTLNIKDYLGDLYSHLFWILCFDPFSSPCIDCQSFIYMQLLVPYYQPQIPFARCRYIPKINPKDGEWIFTQ